MRLQLAVVQKPHNSVDKEGFTSVLVLFATKKSELDKRKPRGHAI